MVNWSRFGLLFLGLVASSGVLADKLTIRADAPQQYVVKKGDTLWDISGIYLTKPWHWPKLWQQNKQIKNPHLIYPGDVLNLVYDQSGNPKLVVNQSAKPSRKLIPSIRVASKAGQPIGVLPQSAISPFLSESTLLDKQAVELASRVLAADSGFITMSKHDVLTVSGILTKGEYQVLRLRRKIESESGEFLGAIYERLAAVNTIESFPAESITRVQLLTSSKEVRVGDIVVEQNISESRTAPLNLSKGADGVQGTVVSANNPQRYHGKWQIIVVDKGALDNIEQGQIYDLLKPGRAFPNPELTELVKTDTSPEVQAGQLVILLVAQKLSLAIISRATLPVALYDRFAAPADG